MRKEAAIRGLEVGAYRVPTQEPESDGTLEWRATTLVTVELHAMNETGLGYTYASEATAKVVGETLQETLIGFDAFDIPGAWSRMVRSIRNLGGSGVCAMAISAVDAALWDLKARLLGVSLLDLWGAARDAVPAYASGGFTSLTAEALTAQLRGWAEQGFRQVKMKVGREGDVERVAAARGAVGDACQLMVDANGAYRPQQALALAHRFAEQGVSWFEEPVPFHDLDGLRQVRDRTPPGMEIAVGEYGYHLGHFRRVLEAGAADVLQADATRCLGPSGLFKASALAEARGLPLSTHTAPAIHLHAACALSNVRHVEYFTDHVNIEKRLLDGVVLPQDGLLRPDRSRPGHGLSLRKTDARPFSV